MEGGIPWSNILSIGFRNHTLGWRQEVIFIPTSCLYLQLNCQSPRHLNLVYRHRTPSDTPNEYTTGNYTAPEIRGMAFRLALQPQRAAGEP